MFSAALAGLLRIGAVTLTAAGLGTGVYFLAQVGGDGDPNLEVRSTVTAPAPNELSPPADIVAPQPTPPDIDTSDWLTYNSPLGFSIKYPPGWVAENTDIPTLPAGRALIMNERAQEARMNERAQEARALGLSEEYLGGEAWIQITPDPFPSFDVEDLFAVCSQRGNQEPSEVFFAGLQAVRCGPKNLSIAPNDTTTAGEVYWVRLPSGRPLHVSWQAVDADALAALAAQTALSTTLFDTP